MRHILLSIFLLISCQTFAGQDEDKFIKNWEGVYELISDGNSKTGIDLRHSTCGYDLVVKQRNNEPYSNIGDSLLRRTFDSHGTITRFISRRFTTAVRIHSFHRINGSDYEEYVRGDQRLTIKWSLNDRTLRRVQMRELCFSRYVPFSCHTVDSVEKVDYEMSSDGNLHKTVEYKQLQPKEQITTQKCIYKWTRKLGPYDY